MLSYRSLAELPIAPDLAVIATPPPTVPGIIAELAARGCRAAIVITAGFGEAGGGGADLRQQMLDAARPQPDAHRRPELPRRDLAGRRASTPASRS